MQVEWVNHASFVIRTASVRVMIDPWLEGPVFDQSWSLLSPTKFKYSDFGDITHIWFSHEHPDHFFPPNLARIPAEIRSRIPVIFQPTIDRRVVEFCRKLGFASVQELPPRWYELSSDLAVWCEPAGRGDSWAAFRSPSHTLLNINDCIYLDRADLSPLKEKLGPIDTLVTQFSYASWWGNRDNDAAWEAAAADQLEKIRREVEVLGPRSLLLSASYVFFDHAENWYMNRWSNTVHEAFAYVSGLPGVVPIVLYPGDRWDAGAPHDSSSALERYAADHARTMANGPQIASKGVDSKKLGEAAREFIRRLKKRNSLLLLLRVPAARVRVTDNERTYALSLRGLTEAGEGPGDIALSSSALLYCLQNDWGGETLSINGRFEEPEGGDRSRFFRWFSIAGANSHGVNYDLGYYARKLARRVVGA
jgi:UDP-MurNAc hydroxylase